MNNLAKYGLVAIIAFFLGGGVVWYFAEQPEPDPVFWEREIFDDMFDDDFFRRSRDPFQEMERLQDEISKRFDRNRSRFESMFDDWFSRQFGDFPPNSIALKEDDEHFYYELEIGENDVANIDVEIENKMIEINATTQSSSNSGERSYAEINQRFPLPPGVDPASIEVTHENQKIVISLRKKVTRP
ncbi:MAG: Hsp20 family protein [Pseudomonadales bacterium]